ncbi:MAG: MOSC domain-containing protein [Planctomycetota bacterium]
MPSVTSEVVGSIETVCVGALRDVEHRGKTVATGIYKSAVEGPVRVMGWNLEGDEQADRSVHGGEHKAVYGFPAEHYPAWREAFPEVDMPWGVFGENLTTRGLTEETVRVGDRYRVGSAELVATQPRQPCFKFSIRMGDPRVGKRMVETGQSGFYFSIAAEGALQAGDSVELVDRLEGALSIAELNRLYYDKSVGAAELRAAVETPGLIEDWKRWLTERADKAG